MFKPNVVTNGLLMSSSEKDKNKGNDKKGDSPSMVLSNSSTMSPGTSQKLSYNDPIAVEERAAQRSIERQSDKRALQKRKSSPAPSKSDNRKKTREAKKFNKSVRKNQSESTESSSKRQNVATGGVQTMVKEAGNAASCSKGSMCGQTSSEAKKVFDSFKLKQGGKKGKAHDKLMKNK